MCTIIPREALKQRRLRNLPQALKSKSACGNQSRAVCMKSHDKKTITVDHRFH